MAEHFFGGSKFGVEPGQRSNAESGHRWVRRGSKLILVAASLAGATGVLSAPASAGNLCVDTDGDGWGWDGSKTCTDMSPVDTPDSAAAKIDDSSFDQSVVDDFEEVVVASPDESGADDFDRSIVSDSDRSGADDFDESVVANLDPFVAGMADGTIVEVPAAGRPDVGDLVHSGSVDIEFDLGTFTRPATKHFYEEEDGSPGLHSVVMMGGSIVDYGPEDDPSVADSVEGDDGTYAGPADYPQVFEATVSQERYQGATPTQGEKATQGEVLMATQRYFQVDEYTDPDERAVSQLSLISSLQAYETQARIAGNDDLADQAVREIERLEVEYENGLSGVTTARQQLGGLGMGAGSGADTGSEQSGSDTGSVEPAAELGSEPRGADPAEVKRTREAMLRDGTLRRRPGQVVERDSEQPETETSPGVEIKSVLPRIGALPDGNDLLGNIRSDERQSDSPFAPSSGDWSFDTSADLEFDWSAPASGLDDWSFGSSADYGFDPSPSASGFDDFSFNTSWDDFSF